MLSVLSPVIKTPEVISTQDRSLFYLVLLGGWMGIVVHSALLLIFLQQSVTVMALVNVASVLIWCYYFKLAYQAQLSAAIYLAAFEMTMHAVLSMWVLGTQYGLQYYLISIAALSAVNANQRVAWLLSSAFLLLLVVLVYLNPVATDTVIFPEHIQAIYMFFLVSACMPVVFGLLIVKNEYMKQRSELEHFANHDALTSLHNRHYFYAFLERQRALCQQHSHAFYIAITDIDNFKQVNDSYGHDVGDEVLVELSDIFTSQLHATDDIARWGGEEFMIFIDAVSRDEALHRLEQVRYAIEVAEFTQHKLKVSSSFGLVCVDTSETIEAAIKRADILLYQAKKNGRNRIE